MRKNTNLYTVLITAFFCFFAHGYRFANTILSHDALLEVVQDDSAWQIALGRIMHPALIFLRGGICSPWLICTLETIWFILAVYFLADLLDIQSIARRAALSGILVCSHSFISTNAAFLQCADFYALALFMSILGIWLMKKGGMLKTFLGIICIVICLGTYQAYVCVALALIVMLEIRKLAEGEGWRIVMGNLFKCALAMLGAAVLYLIGWKLIQHILGIWTADTYNGMARLGDYSQVSFITVLITCYQRFFDFFINPATFVTMTFRGINMSVIWKWMFRLVNIIVFARLGISLYRLNHRKRSAICGIILQVLLIIAFPLCCNFVCLMSQGMEHDLMTFAFLCPYFLCLMIEEKTDIDETANKAHSCKMNTFLRYSVPALLGVIIWSNIVYANQTYYKKSLQEQSAISIMTRIVNDIERHEGYIPGVTPVAFTGTFENSPYTTELPGFDDIIPYGMGKTALTYFGTDYAMLEYVMNIDMNLTRVNDWPLAMDDEIAAMPCYPAEGSIDYVGEILVIKISD